MNFPGSCSRIEERYFYDRRSQKCLKFTYNGCKGNSNRFVNKEKCDEQCISWTRAGQDTSQGYVITEVIVVLIVLILIAIGTALGFKYYKIYRAGQENYR